MKPTIAINAFIPSYCFLNKMWGVTDIPHAPLVMAAACGFDAYEPGGGLNDDVAPVAKRFEQLGLSAPSYFAAPALFSDNAEAEVEGTLATAKGFKELLGTTIVSLNPIWKTEEGTVSGTRIPKTDEELERQAKYFGQLSQELGTLGMTTAYHLHDYEMADDQRDFRSVAQANPGMKHCLDVHWVYQGAGYSTETLHGFLEEFGQDVATLHIRQSVDNIWTETFTAEGDIDYRHVLTKLKAKGFTGTFTLEQFKGGEDDKNLAYSFAEAQLISKRHLEQLIAEVWAE